MQLLATTMDNLGGPTMVFAENSMEQLSIGFAESDPSVTSFLSDGLVTEEGQPEVVEISSSSPAEGIMSSALGLADDPSCLGANLQIGLDVLTPITNSTGNIFDPASSFQSLTTKATSIMEDSSYIIAVPGMSTQGQCSMMDDDTFEGVISSSGQTINPSLVDTTLSLHNYAGPMSSEEKSEVPVKIPQGKGLNPTSVPTRVDIKPAQPNTKPDMLLFHDRATGKNILIPLAALQTEIQPSSSSTNSVHSAEEPITTTNISINVSDFLNMLNKSVGQSGAVANIGQESSVNSSILSGQTNAVHQPFSEGSSVSMISNQALDVSVTSSPGIVSQQMAPLQSQVACVQYTMENPAHLLSQTAANTNCLQANHLFTTSSQSVSLASNTVLARDSLKMNEETQSLIHTQGENLLISGDPISSTSYPNPLTSEPAVVDHVIKPTWSGRSITNKPGSELQGIFPNTITGKRIRKPTAKAEQYKNSKTAKEKKKVSTKPTLKENPIEEKRNESIDVASYSSKVAASSVAHMLDTVGQSAFMEKLDVSVHVDESQCVIVDGHKKWKCLLCPKEYSSKHNLVTHILDHSGIKPHCCMICGKHFKQASHLQTHMLTHGNVKPHSCSVCSRSFSQASHVKRHMAVHMERRPHICSVCERGFAFPSELKAHMEKHENGQENVCDECDISFDSLKKLKAHKASEHSSGELTCKECGKQYTYPSQLRDHMMKHEGKRAYICGECGMDFMKEHHLKAHQFTHTGLKPFVCPDCGRGFNQKANLQRHIMIHEPEKKFNCDVCGRGFTQPQVLKSHLMTHKDSKPFQCKVCGKQFSRLHNLNGHMHMHNGEKPHACHICGASFTLKGNLNRHKKDKHDIDGDTECTEEEAAMILNEMSGKKMVESDTQEAVDDIPTPKKKRKSVPRKTVTEQAGNEEDKEIEAVWQMGLDGSSLGEEGADMQNPVELFNHITNGTAKEAKPGKKAAKKKTVPQNSQTVSYDGTQEVEANAVSRQTEDGSTEWIAYIPLNEDVMEPGTMHEVSIKLVPSNPEDNFNTVKSRRRDKGSKKTGAKKAQNSVGPPATSGGTSVGVISARGRKRKPVNFGEDFISNVDTVVKSINSNKGAPNLKTADAENNIGATNHDVSDSGNVGNSNINNLGVKTTIPAGPESNVHNFLANTTFRQPLKGTRIGKKASLAALLETKLVQSLT